MSADGMLVRSPLEAARLEIEEMSAYATRLEQELSESNLVRAEAEAYATRCMGVAQAMLLGFQMQDAVTVELLNYVAGDPSIGAHMRKLIANIEAARRVGMRRAPVSRPLEQPAAAE